MSVEVPIVFFHIGSQEYFRSSVKIALKNNKVIHVGDSPIVENENYKFVDYRSVSEGFDEFSKVYTHLSFNAFDYELICFLRWIALMNLMRKENIEIAYYSDSDVANLDNMTVAFEKMGKPNVSFVVVENDSEYRWSACGLSSFWSISSITDMVDFMFSCYKNDDKRSKLLEKMKWHSQTNTPGGVCDMTIFYLFSTEKEVFPLNKEVNGEVFDQNINDSENFIRNEYKMQNGIKMLKFKDGHFFGSKSDGQEVRFRTLHCQGNSKNIMMQIERSIENATK